MQGFGDSRLRRNTIRLRVETLTDHVKKHTTRRSARAYARASARGLRSTVATQIREFTTRAHFRIWASKSFVYHALGTTLATIPLHALESPMQNEAII